MQPHNIVNVQEPDRPTSAEVYVRDATSAEEIAVELWIIEFEEDV